jgi:enamine deaminase RidA (YjgF/YER057c/UK114 family)
MRQHFSSGAPWELIVGYSRAVRIGTAIEVSGTVSVKDGDLFGADDAYVQTQQCLKILGDALHALGATYADVIRTRIYVTNIRRDWEAIGRAHGEIFGAIRPATSMVEVRALIDPGYLVEIEASAVLPHK